MAAGFAMIGSPQSAIRHSQETRRVTPASRTLERSLDSHHQLHHVRKLCRHGGRDRQFRRWQRRAFNSIVAGNTATTDNDVEANITPVSSFNLIGDGTGQSGIGNGYDGNIIGTTQSQANPGLMPLANNGGADPDDGIASQ